MSLPPLYFIMPAHSRSHNGVKGVVASSGEGAK
jgi:hypothetical protein